MDYCVANAALHAKYCTERCLSLCCEMYVLFLRPTHLCRRGRHDREQVGHPGAGGDAEVEQLQDRVPLVDRPVPRRCRSVRGPLPAHANECLAAWVGLGAGWINIREWCVIPVDQTTLDLQTIAGEVLQVTAGQY